MNRENNQVTNIINQYQKEITYYSQMQALSVSTYEKQNYQELITERTDELIRMIEHYSLQANQLNKDSKQQAEEPNLPMDNQNQRNDNDERIDNDNNNEDGVTEPIPEEPTAEESNNNKRVFTKEELAKYDGMEGRPIYVAAEGIVYDISTAVPWAGGKHFGGLTAGKDLTMQFKKCHGGMIETLQKYPVVGIYKE